MAAGAEVRKGGLRRPSAWRRLPPGLFRFPNTSRGKRFGREQKYAGSGEKAIETRYSLERAGVPVGVRAI